MKNNLKNSSISWVVLLLLRDQGIKTLLQISAADEFSELHTTNTVPKHREGKKSSSRLGWHHRDAKGPPPTAVPLPQPINDVLCFSKINLIQCTSDFVLHVLENKVTQQLFSHLSCLQPQGPCDHSTQSIPSTQTPLGPSPCSHPSTLGFVPALPSSPSLQALELPAPREGSSSPALRFCREGKCISPTSRAVSWHWRGSKSQVSPSGQPTAQSYVLRGDFQFLTCSLKLHDRALREIL